MQISSKIKRIIEYDRYIDLKLAKKKLRTSFTTALIIAFAFALLSIANIIQQSFTMLYLTIAGAVVECIGAIVGYHFKKPFIIDLISTLTCTALFTCFTIIGGNNGFAILWIILLPGISIALCDMKMGFISSLYFWLFTVISFWTPIHTHYLFSYSETLALRFPLLYTVSFVFSSYLVIAFKKTQYEVLKQHEQLSIDKDFDKMTGVYNRSKYEEMLEKEFANYETIGVIFFDVNYLKETNDHHGHQAGDHLLTQVAKGLLDCSDVKHMVFRIGGDEFVIILPNCTKDDCEKYLSDWDTTLQALKKSDPQTTYSIASGMCFGNHGYNITDLITNADQQMYRSKNTMKNKGL